jgi:hypothetical protein
MKLRIDGIEVAPMPGQSLREIVQQLGLVAEKL